MEIMQPEWNNATIMQQCMHAKLLSVQFSCSVVSDSLRPHESQHARPPCPSPSPGVDSNSRPSSRWCHPAISSSAVPFSSCPQSLSALVMSNSFLPHGVQPARPHIYPWDSLGKKTGVGGHALLQGIFPTQGSNPHFLRLLHWQVFYY